MECDSHQGGVKCIRNVLWRDVMVMEEVLGGVEV